MLRHENIERICCVILALTLLVSALFVGAAATGAITEDTTIGYETRLFDQSRVHTIDIVMDDWDAFLQTCTSEVYAPCHMVIDGESYKNVAIRGKGNTSLSSVATYGNNRYSFKVEFNQYQTGHTYHGLDKLSLNNLIQDNTYMKDYVAYTLMNKMGVAAPLCSFVQINVNGEPWGLYLAVEAVEDAFLQRNYGKAHGELYKPDSLSFGGGRGNGEDFDMGEMADRFGFSFGGNDQDNTSEVMRPDAGNMQSWPDNSGSDDSFGGSSGGSSGAPAGSPEPTATATPEPTATATPEPAATPAPAQEDSFGGSAGDAASNGDAASAGDAASSGMPADSGNPAMPSGIPADGTMPDMSAMPQMPADGTLPEGFDPSQIPGSSGDTAVTAATEAPAMPSGTPADGTMPDMSAMPQMPADGTLPEGFDPSQIPGSSGDTAVTAATEAPAMPSGTPADGTMPDMSAMPQMPADGTLPEGFTPPEMGADFEMPDMGGFGGFGSSTDVKLQYTNDDPSSYSNIFNNAKTDITTADQNRLIASLKALGEGDTSVVDTDAVIRYMAVHNFLQNDDSYTGMMVHNYYLYEENGVLTMIPWDYNLAYGTMSNTNATSSVNADIDRLVSMGSDSDRPMASWITSSEEYMAQYHAVYQEFMSTVFDSGWFAEEIKRVRSMIDPYVQKDSAGFCTYEEFLIGADTLEAFCMKRAESVTRQLTGDSTRVDASELDLSAMGTMNNSGFGGRNNETFGEGTKREAVPAEGAGETAQETQQAMQTDDFASSGGTAASETVSPTADTTERTKTSKGAAQAAEFTPPTFDEGFGINSRNHQTTSDAWVWIAVSAVLLAAAFVIAALYRTNR